MNRHILGQLTSIAVLATASIFSLMNTVRAQQANYIGAAEPMTDAEIYGQGVRETPWLSPAAEQAGFHLPPGFEIELFADDQQITKPLNMAWDARGRLWVTCTVEYPYPAKPDVIPRDTIRILEDTDGDFRADKVTVFADQLNIPMGILPVKDGVICFNIPNLVYLKDVDGDDKVDERIQLLGPFDTTRDTHGMVNSLTRGSDGWIYACHGFNNQSTVEAKDGSKVTLISGNTFRFRDDGSSIQQYTQGQVNPFGLTRDEWGNWYSADCHSKPLTALLPGACYPSFGRPDDGLGFAPDMMEHLHGSTAICGLTYYQASQFPPEYRHLFYSGNVMTSRINCNAPKWNGATITAIEQADFLTSDDPWFRPVDIQLGLDGALYVADFYNKIIGHYEVPLTHPERDRESGRIWRIVYRGDRQHDAAIPISKAAEFAAPNATRQTALQALSDNNLNRRRLAIETVLARTSVESTELSKLLNETSSPLPLRLSALELLHRTHQLGPSAYGQLLSTLASDEQTSAPELMVLALRLSSEQASDQPRDAVLAVARKLSQATEQHPQVRRAAVELLGREGNAADVDLLLEVASGLPSSDPALLQCCRIAVRQLLRDAEVLQIACGPWLSEGATSDAQTQPQAMMLAHILPGVDSELAAKAMLGYVSKMGSRDATLVEQAIAAASRYATPDIIGRLLTAIDESSSNNTLMKAASFHQLCDTYRAKQCDLSRELQTYGAALQAELVRELRQVVTQAGSRVTWLDDSGSDWLPQARNCEDGQETMLTSSHTRGEQYTGVLRSEPIECPPRLSFWLAGHDGHPDNPPQKRNLVQLVNATSGQVLQTAYPPRNDQAQLVVWSLQDCAGEVVRVEIVDGDAGDAYAWLAVGRFSASQLERGSEGEWIDALASSLHQGFIANETVEALNGLPFSPRQRAGLVVAALQGSGKQPSATLAQQAMQLNRVDLLGAQLLGEMDESQLMSFSRELCATATASQQTGLAKSLMANPNGCDLLNKLLNQGVISLLALQKFEAVLPNGLDANLRAELQSHLTAASQLPATSVDVNGRLAKLAWERGSMELGKQMYTQHCAVCHQLRGAGNLVGPQLDGAVVRGRERLAEDVLDPNRNVDRAFRLSALLMDDDSVVTGLAQDSEDGRTVTVTAQDGKRAEYAAELIVERKESTQSLMPANFGELLNDEQLTALLHYLSESH